MTGNVVFKGIAQSAAHGETELISFTNGSALYNKRNNIPFNLLINVKWIKGGTILQQKRPI